MKKEITDKMKYCRADQVGALLMLWNKLKTIRSYNSRKAFKHLKTATDFINVVRRFETENNRRISPVEKAMQLWFLERVSREARIFNDGAFLLTEPKIERFKPILHVGWGMDVLSDTGFDYSRLAADMENTTDPQYRLLVLEPVGIVYIAGQQPLKSRFIGLNIPSVPDPESVSAFFAHFSEGETEMISHGYGRGIYFQAYSLCSALKKAKECPAFFNPLYSIRGLSFAYTMVNISHLDKVYLTAQKLAAGYLGSEETHFFNEGVASSLSFLEWNFPGLMESLEENSFTQRAGEMISSYKKSGGVFHL